MRSLKRHTVTLIQDHGPKAIASLRSERVTLAANFGTNKVNSQATGAPARAHLAAQPVGYIGHYPYTIKWRKAVDLAISLMCNSFASVPRPYLGSRHLLYTKSPSKHCYPSLHKSRGPCRARETSTSRSQVKPPIWNAISAHPTN